MFASFAPDLHHQSQGQSLPHRLSRVVFPGFEPDRRATLVFNNLAKHLHDRALALSPICEDADGERRVCNRANETLGKRIYERGELQLVAVCSNRLSPKIEKVFRGMGSFLNSTE